MLTHLDFHASQAGVRYVDFLNSLRLFVVSAMRRDPTNANVKAEMKRAAIARAREFKANELSAFDFALENTITEARELLLQDVDAISGVLELPETVSAYMDDMSAFFETELTSQLQRDIGQAASRLNDFALEVFMQRTQPFMSNTDAHVKALIDTTGQTRFFFKDRTGRRHPSQKFIRTNFRHVLLLAALHAYSVEAIIAGADHMIVTHPDNKAGVAGTKVGFRREQGYPIIHDLRDEIFHPNSSAFVKAVF